MKDKLPEADIKFFQRYEELLTSLRNEETRYKAIHRMGQQVSYVQAERLRGNSDSAQLLVERWRRKNKIEADLPGSRNHPPSLSKMGKRGSPVGVNRLS